MTKFVVLSLFPEMFELFINTSIIKRAINNKIIDVDLIDIRDFATNKNKKVDYSPYGGGNGMVIMCEPLDLALKYAIKKIDSNNYKIIYLSPRGNLLDYSLVNKLSNQIDNYILICGHYEGIDERIIQKYNITEISIGDYVLTGGELPAMVLIDAISRLKPGVLSKGSLEQESHTNILLEYPQYTKPNVFDGYNVPEVLLDGNHQKIDKYRKEEAIYTTYTNRPDLLKKAIKQKVISKEDIEKIIKERKVK